jgi:peroxiredoxin
MQIGQVAPHISLYNTDRKKIDFMNLTGKKKVLVFFPAAFTSVCTAEMCTVRDNMASFNSLGALVFGISTDSPFTLKKFKEDQHLPFDLLSDYNKEVCRAYGIYREELNIVKCWKIQVICQILPPRNERWKLFCNFKVNI